MLCDLIYRITVDEIMHNIENADKEQRDEAIETLAEFDYELNTTEEERNATLKGEARRQQLEEWGAL